MRVGVKSELRARDRGEELGERAKASELRGRVGAGKIVGRGEEEGECDRRERGMLPVEKG